MLIFALEIEKSVFRVWVYTCETESVVAFTQQIWNCGECYSSFHIQCVQKWAKDSIFQLSEAQADRTPDQKILQANLCWCWWVDTSISSHLIICLNLIAIIVVSCKELRVGVDSNPSSKLGWSGCKFLNENRDIGEVWHLSRYSPCSPASNCKSLLMGWKTRVVVVIAGQWLAHKSRKGRVII